MMVPNTIILVSWHPISHNPKRNYSLERRGHYTYSHRKAKTVRIKTSKYRPVFLKNLAKNTQNVFEEPQIPLYTCLCC